MTATSSVYCSTVAMGAFVLTAMTATAESRAAPVIADPTYTHAAQLVEVAPHRKLNLLCQGSGSPAVIFDSGLSDDMSVWGFVQPVIATTTRACSYDRAGIGFSDPGERSGSSKNIANDLHSLLNNAHIAPPYILVGHSYGGLNMTVFASLYFNEVAGMVLVDPAYQNQVDDARKIIPGYDQIMLAPDLADRRACVSAARAGFAPGSERFKHCIDQDNPAMSASINAAQRARHLLPAYQQADLSERECVRGGKSDEEARSAYRPFGHIPLVVLTRPPSTRPLGNHETPQSRVAFYSAWMTGHNELAARSTNGINRVVPDTGHYIQIDQPAVVSEAIMNVIRSSRH